MPAVILTWNPERWAFEEGEWEEAVELTAAGEWSAEQWSVGRRRSIPDGQRAFLLRQGLEPRGIVASGVTRGEVFEGQHFADENKTGRYVKVSWDVVIEQDDPLPTEVLLAEVPEVPWNYIQGSGNDIADDAVAKVEELWSEHLADPTRGARSGVGGQGRITSPRARLAIENHAQDILEEHFRSDGWQVEDRRVGEPYDAVAQRGDEIRYLEAKGTQEAGTYVLVTRREVEFASAHPGECVMGIVSGIKLTADDEVVPGSGELTVVDWDPPTGSLVPVTYRWMPPRS